MKTLTTEQKNKTIQELVNEGVFDEAIKDMDITSLCELVEQTSAYMKFKSMMIVSLTGSEKQIAWAEKIRDKKISDAASRITRALVLSKIDKNDDTDFNKYAHNEINALKKSSASWWIDNRF